MSRGDQAMANGQLVGSGRNGLPAGRPYRYRGNATMAADERFRLCAAGCGRRIQVANNSQDPTSCAVCRGSGGLGGLGEGDE